MMKEYFIATAIFVGLVAFVMAMSYFSGLDYDILFIEFMLTYLVINKLSEIQNDKKKNNMPAYDVNGRCEDCTFADAFGRSRQHGMLFPVMVLIAFGDVYQCPNFQKKNAEQLQEQIRLKNKENK